MTLYYYEIITKSSSIGYFSGYFLETPYGNFDYWNEDYGDVIYYENTEKFLKDMEKKEGKGNFIMVKI